MPTPTEAPSDTLLTRVSNFVSNNKKLVLIGTSVVVVGGAGFGYYYYTQKPKPGDKKKKKSTTSSSKKKTVRDADGPILEERKPKKVDDEPTTPDSPKLTPQDIASMSNAERTSSASAYKSRGNTAYQKREFSNAIDLYSKAIAVASKPEAVYYSNRAACYMNLNPPQYENVVNDCTEALKLDNTYIKALNRRATALGLLDRDEEALRDYTATTILEKFANEQTSTALEKCLKKLSVAKTEEALISREPRLPSKAFMSAYIAAFRPKPFPALPSEPSQGDTTFALSHDALLATDYTHSFTLLNEALEQGISWDEGKARALNLRGTFKFLIGDTPGAKEDLQASLDLLPTFSQTWVKMASVHMELSDPRGTFEAFDKAIEYDPNDPDIYYHRGQVHFIMQNFDEASEDYNKSTALDDTFVFSHIQYAVAQYKKNEPETAKASFRKSMQLFPERSEVLNYYGELLLDLQRFQEAVEKFERSMELEKSKKPPINVLPMVNKALAMYQWKQDLGAAVKLCEEALSIDPDCDAAVATLAQLYLQTSQLPEALKMFERNVEIARTGTEMEQAYTFVFATKAQLEFTKNYPAQAKELEQMAKMMAGMPGMG